MGWVKLDRQIFDNFLWFEEPFTKAQAWIDLILLANHEDTQIMFNGQFKIIKRGQHLTSLRKLKERWKWSENKVFRFLGVLRNAEMIKTETVNGTLITLVNYDKFQNRYNSDEGTYEGTYEGTGECKGEGQTRTIRNKEIKKSAINGFDLDASIAKLERKIENGDIHNAILQQDDQEA